MPVTTLSLPLRWNARVTETEGGLQVLKGQGNAPPRHSSEQRRGQSPPRRRCQSDGDTRTRRLSRPSRGSPPVLSCSGAARWEEGAPGSLRAGGAPVSYCNTEPGGWSAVGEGKVTPVVGGTEPRTPRGRTDVPRRAGWGWTAAAGRRRQRRTAGKHDEPRTAPRGVSRRPTPRRAQWGNRDHRFGWKQRKSSACVKEARFHASDKDAGKERGEERPRHADGGRPGPFVQVQDLTVPNVSGKRGVGGL